MKRNILPVILGCIVFLITACEKDEVKGVNLTYDISMPLDNNYTRTYQAIDSSDIVGAFNLSYDKFKEYLGLADTSIIHYYALYPDGTINEAEPTATEYGHWFDAEGEVTTWADGDAVLFSEFKENFVFEIGQYPGTPSVNETYTIKQGFQYKGSLASVTFNITITATED